MSGGPSRRAALAALAAAATAACSSRPDGASPPGAGGASSAGSAGSSPSGTSPAPTPSSSSASPEPLPAVPAFPAVPAAAAYALLPGEVEPACKQAALDAASAALTVDAAAPSAASGPLEPLRALVPTGASTALEVVYPQYGGLDAPRRTASVMLVADLLVAGATAGTAAGATAAAPERRSTTVDLRLTSEGGRWSVTEVLVPELPAAAPVDQLPEQTRQLLATDRVVLPGAARADLLAGSVHPAVVSTLLELSRTWRLHVQVLTSGHPVNVFATDRVSNHTRGRAVDLWALDGVPVVEQDRSPWREVVEAATALGASEVGGPQDLGGRGQFTDQVHQDHLHLGFGRA